MQKVSRAKPVVERTSPGSRNRYRVKYEESTKWTNDRPGDHISENIKRRLRKMFKSPAVRRGIERLEKAVREYAKNGNKKPIEEAVVDFEIYTSRETAKTAIRKVYEIEKEKMESSESEEQKKIIEGLEIAKKHLNRRRRDMKGGMECLSSELLRIARELIR